ncbi:MAG: hypothetical protein JRN22_02260 [Nitrososphaerota archaeon]|nr:hypothetical protein [Nitrososphaerota archaeon]
MFEIQQVSSDSLSINCDPEILGDLIMVLSKLLDIAKYLKARKKIAEIEARAKDAVQAAKRRAEFEAISTEVYQRYQSLEAGPENRSKFITQIKAEFGFDSYTAGIYITEGKRLEKQKVRARIREEFKAGRKIIELKELYGLSYQTIKRVINE